MMRTLIISGGLCLCWLSVPGYAQISEYENVILGPSMETHLALKLAVEPDLRLNIREIYDFGEEKVHAKERVKTAGKVALGLALLTLAAGGLFFGTSYITYDPEE